MTQRNLPGLRRSKPKTDEGESMKRKGIEQALHNERLLWRRYAFEILCRVAKDAGDRPFTADDFHMRAEVAGLGKPHHPNVIGGVFQLALNAGVMKKTGHYVKSSRPNQHATVIPEYRAVQAPSVIPSREPSIHLDDEAEGSEEGV